MPARFLAPVALGLLLAGCASHIPEPIRTPLPGGPSLAEARADPGTFRGSRVRWGGTIAAVHNRPTVTRVEMVARALSSEGEPAREDTTPGRFMAEFRGFVDPAVFSEGRRLTVVGTLGGMAERAIGDYAYRFPVVAVEHHYLWPAQTPRREPYPPPWYHDPWYPYHSPHYPYW